VVLDHGLGEVLVVRAVHHHEVARRDLRLARHVDALDIDSGHDLPEGARLPRPDQVHRPAVEAHDRELAGARLDELEQLGREIGPRRLEHGELVGREFCAHDVVELDRDPTGGVEQHVAARLEHPLEPAVARDEGALAVLHGHAQRERYRFMALLLSWPRGTPRGFACSF
jgi:hypothetical protein